MIVVVDYGVGNIASVLNMLDYIGVEAEASGDGNVIRRADKLILPGVGAFDKAMTALRAARLIEPLEDVVLHAKKPVLGVCLGMQLLGQASEEGDEAGLGWIEGACVRIDPPEGSGLKVPNIGWRYVQPAGDSPLFPPTDSPRKFYFVHSYHMRCTNPADVAAVIDYGGAVCCAVRRDNVYGVQFHPEKSHRYGMRLLNSFARDA